MNIISFYLHLKIIHKNLEFNQWKNYSIYNITTKYILSGLSIFVSFKLFRIIYSKYFDFQFFKAKLPSI